MSSPPITVEELAAASQRLDTNVRLLVAAVSLAVFDHAITFGEEVERIWKQKWSGATILFLIIRYVTPLQYVIIITGYTYPHWPHSVCQRFVRFEGSSAVALVAVCQIIMILRVFALCNRSFRLLGCLVALWAAQVSVSAYALANGGAADIPPALHRDVCVLTGKGQAFSGIWIAPLINDSVLFFLTLYRSREYIAQLRTDSHQSRFQRTLWIFLRDGTVYFLGVILVNLFSLLVSFLAPEDFKSFGGPFWQIITSTMVSRLILNLRSVADETTVIYRDSEAFDTTTRLVNRTLGNLTGETAISFRRDAHEQSTIGPHRDFEVPLNQVSAKKSEMA